MADNQEVWNMMRKYKFLHDGQWTCMICKHLIIDACQGSCGCLYCRQCITDYTNENGSQYCPGGTKDCNSKNVKFSTDNHANRTILKLFFACPLKKCSYQSTIAELCQHIRVCDNRPMICPYESIGCTVGEIQKDSLLEHLRIDIHNHNTLIIGRINDLSNEMSEIMKTKILPSQQLPIESNSNYISSENDDEKMSKIFKSLETFHEEIKYVNEMHSKKVEQMESTISHQGNEITCLKNELELLRKNLKMGNKPNEHREKSDLLTADCEKPNRMPEICTLTESFNPIIVRREYKSKLNK